jgi:hypothetical protein
MFFRREKPHVDTFQECIDKLKPLRFETQSQGGGAVLATRNGMGALIRESGGKPLVDEVGLTMGKELGKLVNGGYQQYWLTPSKKRLPAQAGQLKELHAFEEDLKEGLGISSLYNTSLGTTSSLHLYDRVEERDAAPKHKPWEVRIQR